MSTSEQKKEDWMNSKWRPAMGWLYMLVCAFDFIAFPVLWSLLQSISHGQVTSQWQPLTLQGAGLFHVAMGAVLGIAAYGRTKEKMAGAEGGGLGSLPPIPTGFGTSNTFTPTPAANSPTFSSPPATSPSPAPFAAPTFGPKPAGPAQLFPEK
jgi:hypothetical protein